MCWVERAKELFNVSRPEHFTNWTHCDECSEHDETLRLATIDSIGMQELGNPGWDPICFSSIEGKIFYMPVLIRLCIETINKGLYFESFLFHVTGNGEGNDLVNSCSSEQRQFIRSFLEYMITEYPDVIDQANCTDDALKAIEIWSKP